MKTDSNHNKTLRLKPHYIFGTVALATLLALLAAMHPRGNQFIAESLVTIDSNVAPDGDLAARDHLLLSECVSNETVETVLTAMPGAIVKDAGLDELAMDDLRQRVIRKLGVEIERSPGSPTETIHVRYASKSQPFAIRLVAGICEQVAENYNERETNPEFMRSLASADEKIQSLKRQLADLRNTQDRLLQDGVAAWRQTNATSDEAASAGDPGGDEQRDRPPVVSRGVAPSSDAADEFAGDTFGTNLFGAENEQTGAKGLRADQLDGGEWEADEFAEHPAAADITAEDAPFPEMFAESDEQSDSPLQDNEPIRPEHSMWNLPGDSNLAADPANPLDGHPLFEGSDKPALELPLQAGDDPAATPPAFTPPAVNRPRAPSEVVVEQSPTLPEVYDLNPRWSAVSNALSRARLELERSLKKMTPRHPVIVDLKTQIEDLERILAKTPQYLPTDGTQPNPTLTPSPAGRQSSFAQPTPEKVTTDARGVLAGDEIRQVSFTEAEARQRIANSAEFQALSTRIRQVKTELARAINDRNTLAASPPMRDVQVSGEAKLVDSECPTVLPFDLLTLFLPAGVLALVAAIANKPGEAPAVIYSVSDARKSLRSTIIGSISTKNGPVIPAAELGGPPTIVRWLVYFSEVICVAAAVLVMISIFQIPGYTSQFFANPFSAFVTSFDFVVQFIRHT